MQERKKSGFILFGLIFFAFSYTSAQTYTSQQRLNWQIITKNPNTKIYPAYFLGFDGATYSQAHPETPEFSARISIAVSGIIHASLQNEVYIPETDPAIINQLDYLPATPVFNTSIQKLNYDPLAVINFVPIRKNAATGQIEKLLSFSLVVNIEPGNPTAKPAFSSSKRTVTNSLLATGDWYKIGVSNSGIFKLDYNFLKSLGFADNTDLSQIKIYGRGGGMLPELNDAPRDLDLVQNAIQVISSSGKLDPSSYLLFYARGPVSWNYDSISHFFHHQVNYYSDISYYFITANGDPVHPAKRIQTITHTGTPNNEITGFDALDFHEIDRVTALTTAVKSGREWYGEDFDNVTKQSLPNDVFPGQITFDFPQADLTKKTGFQTSMAARSKPASTFDFIINNNLVQHTAVSAVYSYDDFTYAYAQTADLRNNFTTPGTHLSLKVNFNAGALDALGWLNYVEFNVPSQLKYIPGQFSFRTGASYHPTLYNRYHISGSPAGYEIWDVTDFHNVVKQTLSASGAEQTFLDSGNILHEFVGCDGSGYYTPGAYGKVANQDIHGQLLPDMVIVTYGDFKQVADSLALYHKIHDGLSVLEVTPQQVYNEFSSGTQDVSAIRDMMKMFYDRGDSIHNGPKFLLLIGAASYDYKDRVKIHTNFVPTYQGYLSTFAANSFCTDDYYTMLNSGQGTNIDYGSNILMQCSVGRLPIYNVQQGMDIYHKILRYNDAKSMHDWRNIVTFIADDRNNNGFVMDAESCTEYYIKPQSPVMNVKKLYFDATPEENTAAGQLFPQINQGIDENMSKGCLVMDYIGHGGQAGWGHEKVLTIPMINGWKNLYNMPLIISATCQFSTFDDPDNISAGELALFNPQGGPIALLTTTREVDAGSNSLLDRNIVNNNLLNKDKSTGLAKYIGEVFVDAKNAGPNSNNLNFSLLGDPAIRLALPRYEVNITNIGRHNLSSDTFKALSLMTIEGEVDKHGQIISDFDGDVYPTVFDKVQIKTTLGQASGDPSDPDSPYPFNTQESIIYKGHAAVQNGKFSFQFVVPKDISFTYGHGKLSLYAANGVIDAHGFNDSIIVGGSDENATLNTKAPHVKLFMNDTNFVAGGITNENPLMIARVQSDVGINTLGSVGHDLLAYLTRTDNPSTDPEPVVLNNFYSADKGSYQSGTIAYPYTNLADGHYQLSVKVWDVADSSAEASTDFIVISSSKLTIDKIFNYPNPFTDETTFQFEDNRPDEALHVDISIFDIKGKMVKDLQGDLLSAGDRHTEMHWDGTTAGGAKIAAGMYVYQLTVKSADGQVAQKSQKLVFVK